MSKIDGKIFGIPMQRYDPSPRMTFVRKAWMDKLGYTASKVKTIEDWYTMLKDFAEKDPDGNGKRTASALPGPPATSIRSTPSSTPSTRQRQGSWTASCCRTTSCRSTATG
ncbi:MAG: hypothetical protein HC888_12070 [Candidatus Competibacteraceae bacterium]|nr:hypothetical protein [Candidatus Competibacteraceae bacterium]